MCQPRGIRCPSSAKKTLEAAMQKVESYEGDDPNEKRRLQTKMRRSLREFHLTSEGQKSLQEKIKEAKTEGDPKRIERLEKELKQAKEEASVKSAASKKYVSENRVKKSLTNFLAKHGFEDGVKPLYLKDGTVSLVVDPKRTDMSIPKLKEELTKSRLGFIHVEVLGETAKHWTSESDPSRVYSGFMREIFSSTPENGRLPFKRTSNNAAAIAEEGRRQRARHEQALQQIDDDFNARMLELQSRVPSNKGPRPDYTKELQEHYDAPSLSNRSEQKGWWEMTPAELEALDNKNINLGFGGGN